MSDIDKHTPDCIMPIEFIIGVTTIHRLYLIATGYAIVIILIIITTQQLYLVVRTRYLHHICTATYQRWLCGIMVGRQIYDPQVVASTPGWVAITTIGNCLQKCKPSRYITNITINSAFNPSRVNKSSTSLSGEQGVKLGYVRLCWGTG